MNNQNEVKFFYIGTRQQADRFLQNVVHLNPKNLTVVDAAHKIEGYNAVCIIFVDPQLPELKESVAIVEAIDRLIQPAHIILLR